MESNLLLERSIVPISRNAILLPNNEFFATNFSNITMDGFATTGWNGFTGNDAETGYSWHGKSAQYPNGGIGPLDVILSGINHGNDYALITSANYTSYGNTTITLETGPDGADENVITLNLLDAGAIANGVNEGFGGQMWVAFLRTASNTIPLPAEVDNLYISYYCKMGSFLNTMPAGDSIILNLKKGGYDFNYGGDLRLTVRIEKTTSNNFVWKVVCDHGADALSAGITLLPTGTEFPYNNNYNNYTHWKAYAANSVVVPTPETWFKLEFFVRTDITGGCVFLAIDDVPIIKVLGQTMGEFELPWGRIFTHGVYTQNGIGSSKMARLRIADYPPETSILYDEIVNTLF